MIVTRPRLLRGLALLALILLMTLLFFLSLSPLQGKEKEVVAAVLRFKQADAELNETILRTHVNLLHNYDPLVEEVGRLRATTTALRATLPDEGDLAPTLREGLDRIDAAIEAKEELLERFKRANAIRKNSQRYFPVVAGEFQRLLMARADHPASLMDDLFGLTGEILEQRFRRGDEALRRVRERADRLLTHAVVSDAEARARRGVVDHALLVAEGMGTTEDLIHRLLDYPLTETVDRLYDEVRLLAERDRRRGEGYRFLIFLSAVLLLVYIGYLLMRLRRTVRTLGQQKFALDQHAAVTAAGTDWRVTYANEAMSRLSHYPPGELNGRDQRVIDGGKEAALLFAELEGTLGEGKVWKGEYRSLDREGRPYWVDAAFVPFLDDQGAPVSFMTIRTDISARKRAERERIRLHMAIEQAADSIVITDAMGNIEYANPAFEAITGYGREEVLGLNPRILKSGKHEPPFYRRMWDDLTSGRVWEGRMINRRKDGALYEEEVTITPVLDAAGGIINYVAVKSDITRRETLVKAREFFSSIASHELRTPLTKLQLVKMILEQKGEVDIGKASSVLAECYDDLERLIASTTLLSELQLNLPDTSMVMAPLGPLVLSAVDIARTQGHSRGREIVFDVRVEEAKGASIRCDPHLVLRALGEVLSNAVAFSPSDAPIRVTCRPVAQGVEVAVVDRAVGMNPVALSMVREPFFSVSNPGHHQTRKGGEGGTGIGLGLTICTLIVESHGGTLAIESAGEGEGVTVRLRFPLAEGGGGRLS
ncbi:MAG: PAS domain S-box protein [Nitrospinae bacterium]|nr:PAS domain S-box protein [Nitrospinota bacterium]